MIADSDHLDRTPEQIKEAARKLQKKKELEQRIGNACKQKARLTKILNQAAKTKEKSL